MPSKVADTLKPFDGKFLVRTPEKLVKEGEETTLTDKERKINKEALGNYNSDEHQKIVVQRRKATDPKSTIEFPNKDKALGWYNLKHIKIIVIFLFKEEQPQIQKVQLLSVKKSADQFIDSKKLLKKRRQNDRKI